MGTTHSIMFRGEPLSLHLLFIGLLNFLLTLVFGLGQTGLLGSKTNFPELAHYYLAIFGWVGALIFGSQLQFYRAITNLRRYGPNFLRFVYLASYITGLVSIILGIELNNYTVFLIGQLLYAVFTSIHFIWLTKQAKTSYFKFPLDYFYVAHIFFLIGQWGIIISSITTGSIELTNITPYTHDIVIGWICLTLMGAMIRIIPMFVGQTIDRQLRGTIGWHFYVAVISTILIIITFYDTNISLPIHALIGVFWFFALFWAVFIVGRSIFKAQGPLDNSFTLFFFVPGLLFFLFGLSFGLMLVVVPPTMYLAMYRMHIHYTFLFGLSMIMMGAVHRITTFQIYTLLYTGKREDAPSMKTFFHASTMKMIAVVYALMIIPFSIGLMTYQMIIVGIVGAVIFVCVLVFVVLLVSNYKKYWKHKAEAIPFDLKPSEV